MRHRKDTRRSLCVRASLALAGLLVASSAQAQAYVYKTGSNFVDMSGSRCRTQTLAQEANVIRPDGSLLVTSSVSNVGLFCPLTRRGTEYYGMHDFRATQLRMDVAMILRASDYSSSRTLSCNAVAARPNNGAIYYGPTRWACSSLPCDTAPSASYTGTSNLYLPVIPSGDAVNWYVSCDIPGGSYLHWVAGTIHPN